MRQRASTSQAFSKFLRAKPLAGGSQTPPKRATLSKEPLRLGARVDTIHVAFTVANLDDALIALQRAKARAGERGVGGRSVIEFPSHRFQVDARGYRLWPFCIRDRHHEILIGEREIEVRMLGAYFSRFDWRKAIDDARVIADSIGGEVLDARIVRLDICVDVTFAINDVDSTYFVRRSRKPVSYEMVGDARAKTSITFGRSGNILVRLYDKIEQLRSRGDAACIVEEQAGWSRRGWQDGMPVTRVEVQLRRRALARLGLRKPERLTDGIDGVWKYIFQRWLRLVKPTVCRRERAPLDPRWQVVVDTVFVKDTNAVCPRDVVSGAAPLRTAIGMLVSALAGRGYLSARANAEVEVDLAEAMQKALRAEPEFLSTLRNRIEATCARFGDNSTHDRG